MEGSDIPEEGRRCWKPARRRRPWRRRGARSDRFQRLRLNSYVLEVVGGPAELLGDHLVVGVTVAAALCVGDGGGFLGRSTRWRVRGRERVEYKERVPGDLIPSSKTRGSGDLGAADGIGRRRQLHQVACHDEEDDRVEKLGWAGFGGRGCWTGSCPHERQIGMDWPEPAQGRKRGKGARALLRSGKKRPYTPYLSLCASLFACLHVKFLT
jgi:hypothetical protein